MVVPEDIRKTQPEQMQIRIEGLDALRAAAVEVAAGARRELQILSTDLQAWLYDQQPFLDVVRQLVTSGRRPTIRILVLDVDTAVTSGHRLVELARQLSSFIEIRRLDLDDAGLAETFLLADRLAFIRQSVAERGRTAVLAKRAPFEGRELARRFEELWQRALSDPNLRRLWL